MKVSSWFIVFLLALSSCEKDPTVNLQLSDASLSNFVFGAGGRGYLDLDHSYPIRYYIMGQVSVESFTVIGENPNGPEAPHRDFFDNTGVIELESTGSVYSSVLRNESFLPAKEILQQVIKDTRYQYQPVTKYDLGLSTDSMLITLDANLPKDRLRFDWYKANSVKNWYQLLDKLNNPIEIGLLDTNFFQFNNRNHTDTLFKFQEGVLQLQPREVYTLEIYALTQNNWAVGHDEIKFRAP